VSVFFYNQKCIHHPYLQAHIACRLGVCGSSARESRRRGGGVWGGGVPPQCVGRGVPPHWVGSFWTFFYLEIALFGAFWGVFFTDDDGGGVCFRPRARVRLSVCVQDYSKTRAWIWMKCCISTDVGTWTNWSTFERNPDHSPDAGTGLLSPIAYALQHGILLRRENLTYWY